VRWTALGALSASCVAALAGPPAARAEGRDFLEEALLLYRAVACGPGSLEGSGLEEAVVRTHCRLLTPGIESYRKTYVTEAKAFLAALRPKDLPRRVVYPFGGGDLLSALTTYPDAFEITTLSLEHAGDPRRIRDLPPKKLEASLALVRSTLSGLLLHDDSKTENLMKGQRGEIPGQLAFFLVALAIHGFEPVGLLYFRLEADGSIHYYSEQEIASLEEKSAGLLRPGWTPPDFSPAFSHAELRFAPVGSGGGPRGAVRLHRHLAADLSDVALRGDRALLGHLEPKGPVAAMTKAASYLLWRDDFSRIRGYLLGHMVFMISDSTGIPPSLARRAGFVEDAYGRFDGSFLDANRDYNDELRALFAAQPERPLPFRYGYLDAKKRNHLLVTRRPGPDIEP
jgi:hypothetical protein